MFVKNARQSSRIIDSKTEAPQPLYLIAYQRRHSPSLFFSRSLRYDSVRVERVTRFIDLVIRQYRRNRCGWCLFFAKWVTRFLCARVSLSSWNIHIFRSPLFLPSVFVLVDFLFANAPQIHLLEGNYFCDSIFPPSLYLSRSHRYFNCFNGFQNFDTITD